MFLQTSTGLIICVGLPLLLLVGYDLLRRRAYERNQKEDTEALLRELEELYREKGEI
jgi:signal peptidase